MTPTSVWLPWCIYLWPPSTRTSQKFVHYKWKVVTPSTSSYLKDWIIIVSHQTVHSKQKCSIFGVGSTKLDLIIANFAYQPLWFPTKNMSTLVLGVPKWTCLFRFLHTNLFGFRPKRCPNWCREYKNWLEMCEIYIPTPLVSDQNDVRIGIGSTKMDLNFSEFYTPTPLIFDTKWTWLFRFLHTKTDLGLAILHSILLLKNNSSLTM